MNPVSPMFQQYGSSIAPRLRLQQLVDIARAYEVHIVRNSTKKQVLPIIIAAEEQGVFNGPPKNPWYFEKAKYNADQLKDAKIKGIAIGPLARWTGPDPDPKPELEYHEKVSQRNTARNANNVISGLRKEAKALGLNSFGKGRDELARMIAEKRGEMAPQAAE